MHANGTSPKRLVGPMMEKLKEHTTSEDGDVGPDGMNLPKYWMEQEDRAMLVAVESVVTKNDTTTFCADTTMDATASDIDTNDATTKGKVVIVGCCGVKMGTSETQPGPETDVGSVYGASLCRCISTPQWCRACVDGGSRTMDRDDRGEENEWQQ